MKALQQSLGETQSKEVGTLPRHLTNFQWSREQKWNRVRVSTVYIRIFRRAQTSEHRQYCHVGDTAQQCRLGLFQDSDFAGDLEDSKSTSRRIVCIFGSHTLMPISWMCKKQTSFSHSSTEAEIISLDAGSRMTGIPALTLWDLVIEVFRSVPNRIDGPKREPRRNPSAVVKPNMHNPIPIKHTNVIPTDIDHILPNTTHPSPSVLLYFFEDTEAVIKMIIKRSKSHNETCFNDPQSCSGLVV